MAKGQSNESPNIKDIPTINEQLITDDEYISCNNCTNNNPLHESLSPNIHRNELTASPNQANSNGRQISHYRTESMSRHSPAKVGTPGSVIVNRDYANTGMCRRSSDSDLSITPKGNSQNTNILYFIFTSRKNGLSSNLI